MIALAKGIKIIPLGRPPFSRPEATEPKDFV